MFDTLITYGIYAVILALPLFFYLRSLKKRDAKAQEAAEKGKMFSHGPQAQHPHIDTNYCIGCATCTTVCPEGDVLAMLAGKAVIVNGHKCIGHSLCAEACPVGAITMVMANPSMRADVPYLTPQQETSIPGLFIIGELSGLALIKNAVNHGRATIDLITQRLAASRPAAKDADVLDVCIVGAGPAGISASLRAIQNKLRYVTLERDEIGGTVAKYPRQKLVMTSPVEFPMYGKFNKTELSKENLLAFWDVVMNRADFNAFTGQVVDNIVKDAEGVFTVSTTGGHVYRARNVLLALGKTGTPRKLEVKGEELPKVMYRLIEADHYINKNILVVGGGDSAVEAAMGLASQVGNKVTLSYRKEAFSRIKERNTQRITDFINKKKLTALFNSVPVEIKESSVVMEVNGQNQEIPNDFVWVFAGGEPPTAFLKKIGVRFGEKEMILEASAEAKEEARAKKAAL
jgi:thioredoxin reductase (NADPH)